MTRKYSEHLPAAILPRTGGLAASSYLPLECCYSSIECCYSSTVVLSVGTDIRVP